MNVFNYEQYIVIDSHCWNDGLIMSKYQIPNWQKWGMIISHNLYSNNFDYCNIGYSLLPFDNFNHLKYNKSINAPWVNNDWLPLWSYLTINKSKILISLEYTFFKKKCLIISNIFKNLNLPIDLINLILSFNKNFFFFNLIKKNNNNYKKYKFNIKKLYNLLHIT